MLPVTGLCTGGLGQTYMIIYTTYSRVLIYTIR